MPNTIKGPDGRVWNIEDGATQEDVEATLRQAYPEQFKNFSSAAPAPAPAAAPAAPAKPKFVDPYAGMSPKDRQAAITKDALQKTLDGMSFGEKMLVGAGQAFNNIGQGAQQIYGNLFDKDLANRVAAERATNADADKALGQTAGGRIGNIAGNAAAAIPIAMGAGMLGTAGAAATGIGALDSAITTGALAGGAQSALQATDPGQSRMANTLTGAALGGAIPALGIGAKAAWNAAKPYAPSVGSVVGGMIPGHTGRILAKVMQGAGKDVAPEVTATERAAAQNAARQDIGSEMGKIMNNQTDIPITLDNAMSMNSLKGAYRNTLDADTKNAMDDYIQQGISGGSIKANVMQRLRSDAIKDANDATGKASNAYFGLQRELDNTTDNFLNSQPQHLAQAVDGLSDAQRLANFRTAYGQTFKGVPINVSNIPGSAAYNTANAVKAQALRKAAAAAQARALQAQALQIGVGQQAAGAGGTDVLTGYVNGDMNH